jgi:hypothetical protein
MLVFFCTEGGFYSFYCFSELRCNITDELTGIFNNVITFTTLLNPVQILTYAQTTLIVFIGWVFGENMHPSKFQKFNLTKPIKNLIDFFITVLLVVGRFSINTLIEPYVVTMYQRHSLVVLQEVHYHTTLHLTIEIILEFIVLLKTSSIILQILFLTATVLN